MERPDNIDKSRALEELQENIDNHYQWSKKLYRTLICGTPPEDDALLEDAHCRCKLGKWLLGRGKKYYEHHPRFQNIVDRHKLMHDIGRELAHQAMQGERITPEAYDAFQEAQSHLREEIQTTYKELHKKIVTTDPLTGANTRATMHDQLYERIGRTQENPDTEWLIMMDLDHFKVVNDTYGHAAGDDVLSAVSATVRKQIRSNDLFFRYGGEEFLLSIGDVDQDQILEIIDRIRHAIELTQVEAGDGTIVSVTSSFGIAGLSQDLSVEETIDLADKALYDAKRAGRNRVHLCSRNISLPNLQAG